MIITVDGPTASGKGSLARALAQELTAYYLDTGSLYRAIGYAVSQKYDRAAVKATRVARGVPGAAADRERSAPVFRERSHS